MLTDDDLNEPAIQSIAHLAEKAVGAKDKIQLVPIPNHPDGDLLVVKPDGSHSTLHVPGKPRVTFLRSVDQVAPYATEAVERWNANPIVYYDQSSVVVVLDESNLLRQNAGLASVALQPSFHYKLLKGYADDRAKAWQTHKQFMQTLRIDLQTAMEELAWQHAVRACEQLESDDATQTRSTSMRTRESLGKDILQEIRSSAGEIPERLVLKIRLFKDPALVQTRQIICGLELDPGSSRFAILPLDNELENAMDEEMAYLGDLLRGSLGGTKRLTIIDKAEDDAWPDDSKSRPIPVFYGTP